MGWKADLVVLKDWRTWMLVLALLPFGLLIAREWGYQLDLNPADHIQYIAHAEALLDGRPYTDTGYIYNEHMRLFAPRAYPPGLPIVLALAFAVFGVSHVVAKIVALSFGVGLILAAGVYFNRERAGMGLAVALTVGLSPKYLEMSVGVMSDIPFAFLVWLTILLADGEGEWTLRQAAFVTASAGWAVLFRPHGLLLLPALAIWGLLHLRRRGWLVLLPAAALTLATVAGRIVVGPESLRVFPAAAALWESLTDLDFRYGLALLESHLYPLPGDLPNDVFHIFTLGLMFIGLAEFSIRRAASLAVIFAVVYTLALGAIPGSTIRWSIPLYPLWVFGVYNGLRIVVQPLFPRRGVVAAVTFATLLAIGATARGLTVERFPPRYQFPDFASMMEHVRQITSQRDDLRIASFRPRWIAAETGAPGMPLLVIDDPEEHIRAWCESGITHVVLGGFDVGRRGTVVSRRAIETRPEAFTSEHVEGEYEVMEIDRVVLGCEGPPGDEAR